MEIYVGLDVHGKETVYEAQASDGSIVKTGRVPTTPSGFEGLAQDLPAGTKVGLETGSMAFYVARQLLAHDLEPIVIDAHEVRLKAHRPKQKSDRRDAHEICEGLRRDIYRTIVHVPPLEIQQIRGLLSCRRHFVRQMTREINAVKQLLKTLGLNDFTRRKLTRETSWDKLISDLGEEPRAQRFVGHHHRMWRCAQEQKASLEEELAALQEPYADKLKLLQTLPGVGPVVSLTIVSALSDVTRFRSAKQVASYAGVVPSTFQTGAREHHGHITKRGSPELRAMLCEAAHHARRASNPFNPYFTKVCAKRGYKIAVTATAHRLLRIAWSMLRKSEPFDESRLGVERVPRAQRAGLPWRAGPVPETAEAGGWRRTGYLLGAQRL